MGADQKPVNAPPFKSSTALLESAVEQAASTDPTEPTASPHQVTPLDVTMLVVTGVGIGTAIALLFH